MTLLLAGLAIILWLLPGPRKVGPVVLDVHTMLGGATLVLIGFQSVAFAILAKVFAVNSGLMPWTPGFRRIFDWITLETGLVVGTLLILGGLVGIGDVLDLGPIRLRAARPPKDSPLGHTRRDGDRTGLPDRAFQFLFQHARAQSEMTMSEFDSYAGSYAATLNRALAVTGESVDYYAEQRVVHLARRLKERSVSVAKILDFGCGTGTGTPDFLRHLGVTSVTGVDVSNESLQVASSQFADLPAHFENLASFQPRGDFDLAFCNGVFHHIPPMERLKALGIIHRLCAPGGFLRSGKTIPGIQGHNGSCTTHLRSRCCQNLSPRERVACCGRPDFAC